MQSLRTRRSQAPPSKTHRSPSKLAKSSTPSSSTTTTTGRSNSTITKNRKSSKAIDDKIKKRLSMRYADISGPTGLNGDAGSGSGVGAGAIPDVPQLPRGVVGGGMISAGPGARGRLREQEDEGVRQSRGVFGGAGGVGGREEEALEEEKKVLEGEEFDPDAFLKSKLGTSTEAELKSLQSSLRTVGEETAAELQQSVFKNYAEFVVISKEISTLENEMLELKSLLLDWKSMPSLLHIDSSLSLTDRKRAARSSIADLRVLYANQMQSLHAQIEGSAKFAPTISGRHVIAEVPDVSSLNGATFKVDKMVKFVVLDDLVLVARKKRRGGGDGGGGGGGGGGEGESKLVAEKCWSLNDMLVLDTKDTPSMTNVFKIRAGKETHVYRTETSTEKKNLLSLFRQVAEELSAKRRKEREGEHERRKTMLWNGAGGSRTSYANDDWMTDLAHQAGMSSDGGAKEKAERDMRFVGEWSDELTVAIALKEWDKAVKLVEEGKEKLPTLPLLSTKLPLLTSSLTTSLLTALSSPTTRKSQTILLTSYLIRLGASSAARKTFLDMRSEVLRNRVRKIRFEGHVGAYVGDLAVVWFGSLKHTADWFLMSFKENEVASSFIDWAKDKIEEYAEIFRMQVYTPDVDPKVVDDALKITYMQSRKLLQEYGLDFRFMLDELLIENPKPRLKPEPGLPPSLASGAPLSSSSSRASLLQIPTSPRAVGGTPVKKRSGTKIRTSEREREGSSSSSAANGVPPLPSLPSLGGASMNGSAGYRPRTPSSTSTSTSMSTPPLSMTTPSNTNTKSGISMSVTAATPNSHTSGYPSYTSSTSTSISTSSSTLSSSPVTPSYIPPSPALSNSSAGLAGYGHGAHPRPPRTPPPHSHRSNSGYGGAASPSLSTRDRDRERDRDRDRDRDRMMPPPSPSMSTISRGSAASGAGASRTRSGSIGTNGRAATPSGGGGGEYSSSSNRDRDRDRDRDRYRDSDRERERKDSTDSAYGGINSVNTSTSMGMSMNGRTTPVSNGAAAPPPPRSVNRPGSQVNMRQPAVAVAKRQGMF